MIGNILMYWMDKFVVEMLYLGIMSSHLRVVQMWSLCSYLLHYDIMTDLNRIISWLQKQYVHLNIDKGEEGW